MHRTTKSSLESGYILRIDLKQAIEFLRSNEWIMGNGQCGACYGLAPGKWYREGGGDIFNIHAKSKDDEGHKTNCKLAKALESLGETVVYKVISER